METKPLTANEVARRLGVSRATVYRWASEGTLASVRIGGTVRFNAEDVDALLQTEGPDAA